MHVKILNLTTLMSNELLDDIEAGTFRENMGARAASHAKLIQELLDENPELAEELAAAMKTHLLVSGDVLRSHVKVQ